MSVGSPWLHPGRRREPRGVQLDIAFRQVFQEVRAQPRRRQPTSDAATFVDPALYVEPEQILHRHGIALHAHDLRHARHPTDPVLEADRSVAPLRGEVPDPVNPPPGCNFHPRCPLAEPICRQVEPALAELMPTHHAACHVAACNLAARAEAVKAQIQTADMR